MKTALITGVGGQDGSYLAEYLLDNDYEVHGMIRISATEDTKNIGELEYNPRFYLHYGDLTDFGSILSLIKMLKPDEIYNLGAQSHVGKSFKLPIQTSFATGFGVLYILEAVKQVDRSIRVYQASTSELYGDTSVAPQNEDTPFNPTSPYAVAKQYAYFMCETYKKSYDMFVCNGILFNHESPRRGEHFVTQKIVTHMIEVVKRQREVVELGNLGARRDWGYAGDYIKAMHKMMQRGEPDNYVIATGKTRTVREFATTTAEQLGLGLEWRGSGDKEIGVDVKTKKTIVRVNPDFYRPADVNLLLGDPTKARKELGWEPETSFEDLIKLMIGAKL